MTEEEAKTADCIGPKNCGIWTYKRISIHETPTWKDVKDRRLCIGSACKMAWRWIPREREQCGYGDQPRPEGEGWYIVPRGSVSRWVRDLPPTDGFCRLAGKP